jgi:large subunit ribosomal protein L35
MPKMKTKRAAAKRFKVRESGSLKRWSANRRHLLSSKNKKRKRNLRGVAEVDKTNAPELHRIIPYGA